MREMLEPVFGESGAVVAQFLITLAIILLVIGLAYWLVRRFTGFGFPGAARGRVPRLAVIDALPVDSRRRLVLVRRDNVEHLLLIGGTSDLVVEPSIQRTSMAAARPRPPQPQAAPQAQQAPQPGGRPAAAPYAAPQPLAEPSVPQRPEATGISEPIPFPPQAAARPQARRPAAAVNHPVPPPAPVPAPEPAPQRRAATRPVPVATEPLAAVAPPAVRPLAASAHFEEPTRPTRIESRLAVAETVERVAEPIPAPAEAVPVARAVEPEPVPETEAPSPAPEPLRAEPAVEHAPAAEVIEIGSEPAPAIAMDEAAIAETAPPDEVETPADERERAAKVSDLEREMARLLGQITAQRES